MACALDVVAHRIGFWSQPCVGQKVLCTRCGRGVYGHRTSLGLMCSDCRRQTAAEIRPELVATADALAAAYHLDEDGETARLHLIETLATAEGVVRVQASSGPSQRLYVAADARALAVALRRHEVGLQARTVGRALWGLSLQVAGLDLEGLRRAEGRSGHYAAEEIPWGVVEWARQSAWVAWWLHRYARALSARYADEFGREHSSLSARRLAVYLQALDDAQRYGVLPMVAPTPPMPGLVRWRDLGTEQAPVLADVLTAPTRKAA